MYCFIDDMPVSIKQVVIFANNNLHVCTCIRTLYNVHVCTQMLHMYIHIHVHVHVYTCIRCICINLCRESSPHQWSSAGAEQNC